MILIFILTLIMIMKILLILKLIIIIIIIIIIGFFEVITTIKLTTTSQLTFFAPQFPKTVLTLTKLEKGKAAFIRSTQVAQTSLMCSVTKKQPEEVG